MHKNAFEKHEPNDPTAEWKKTQEGQSAVFAISH